MTSISVIIPLLNEEENLVLLHERLTNVLTALNCSYEIIFIDDGSFDNSPQILQQLYKTDGAHVRIIEFRRNFGKTAALVAGFEEAKGDVVITMDADLQDDPGEIPQMLEVLHKGYDIVSAWRIDRQDRATKKLSSRLFNYLVTKSTGTTFRDLNCGFKVYRKEVIKSIRLYSDMHRFIPIIAVGQGYKVVEQAVSHHPRHSGRSKYGTRRASRGIIDLLTVLYLTKYARNPMRLFGWAGLAVFGVAFLACLYLAILWFLRLFGLTEVPPIGTRPLFFAGILGMILGFQLLSIGLLGEMVRYYTYNSTEEYSIKQVWK
jgi:glycosyltransferase involved in cell wall biosynthesis